MESRDETWEGGDGAVIRADGDRLELLLFH